MQSNNKHHKSNDRQLMRNKISSKECSHVGHSSRQQCVHHNTGCLKESKQSMVTREAGKPVNIVTLEPDRLDVCSPNLKPQTE